MQEIHGDSPGLIDACQILAAALIVAIVIPGLIVVLNLPRVVTDPGIGALAVFRGAVIPADNLKTAADVAGVAGGGRRFFSFLAGLADVFYLRAPYGGAFFAVFARTLVSGKG